MNMRQRAIWKLIQDDITRAASGQPAFMFVRLRNGLWSPRAGCGLQTRTLRAIADAGHITLVDTSKRQFTIGQP